MFTDTMPSCSVHNCKSRTYWTGTKEITFYRFPREETVRQLWLNACERSEGNIKIDSGTLTVIFYKAKYSKIAYNIRDDINL